MNPRARIIVIGCVLLFLYSPSNGQADEISQFLLQQLGAEKFIILEGKIDKLDAWMLENKIYGNERRESISRFIIMYRSIFEWVQAGALESRQLGEAREILETNLDAFLDSTMNFLEFTHTVVRGMEHSEVLPITPEVQLAIKHLVETPSLRKMLQHREHRMLKSLGITNYEITKVLSEYLETKASPVSSHSLKELEKEKQTVKDQPKKLAKEIH